jgi:hypothetical protein
MAKRARVQIALRLPYEMVTALRRIRDRHKDGPGVTEQIETAVWTYLSSEKEKAERKRTRTSKRS